MTAETQLRQLWVSIRESVTGDLTVKFGGGTREQFFEVLANLKSSLDPDDRKFNDADKSWRVRRTAFRELLVWARDNFQRDRIRLQVNDLEALRSQYVDRATVSQNGTAKEQDASFGGSPTSPAPASDPNAVGDVGKLHRQLREARDQLSSQQRVLSSLQRQVEEAREQALQAQRQVTDSTRLAMENERLRREIDMLRRTQRQSPSYGSDNDLAELHIQSGAHVTGALVKAMYRAVCTIYHPDRGGSEAKMKAVNNAYDRLKRRYNIV
jgi:regulator of replication initiation timing